jgi:Tol biopolymer transport system component/DNA-binding winged helix-turn-helix (wHTH) protein
MLPFLLMQQTSGSLGKVRFGVFEADFLTGELRKFGVKLKVQTQPLKVLSALIEQPGQLVTREELQKRLWDDGTIVDFDHGLGTAINKLREALGDSAENPRFIETLARRGYRFIAPVHSVENGREQTELGPQVLQPSAAAANARIVAVDSPSAPASSKAFTSTRPVVAAVSVAICSLVILAYLGWSRNAKPQIVRTSQITWSGRVFSGSSEVESFPGLVTDGTRVYFTEVRDGRFILAHALLSDGETHPLTMPSEIVGPSLADISTDGSKLLIRNHLAPEVEQPLWVVPSAGGAALRVLNVLAHDATWMPDGNSILYASGQDLYVTRNDGQDPRKFATLPGRAFWLRWSPNGNTLRFTLVDSRTRATSLWELSVNDRKPRQILSGWLQPSNECCGSWTPDGRYFIFQATRGGTADIWAVREGFLGLKAPIQVTAGPLNYTAPIMARDGSKIFVIGTHARNQLFRYDSTSHRLVRYLVDLTTANRVSFSPEKARIAWISTNDSSLWVSRADGSQRLQLTSNPMRVYMMTWSPDGKQLAFMGRIPGHPWKIYTVFAGGGSPQMLLTESRNEADPGWSPDGKTMIFGRLPDYMGEASTQKEIQVVNLKTGAVSILPESEGLFSPRWSPDGHSIAAITLDQRKLVVYDLATHKWSQMAAGSVDNPVWSRDNQSIYFHSFMEEGSPILRVQLADHRVERVFEFGDVQLADAVDYQFPGLAPDDSPLVSVTLWTADVYSLDWKQR